MNIGITYNNAAMHQMLVASHTATPLFLLVSHTYGMRFLVYAFIIPAISQPLRGSCMAGYHHLMPTASLPSFDDVDAQPSFGADGSQPSFDAVGSPPSFDTGYINRLQK